MRLASSTVAFACHGLSLLVLASCGRTKSSHHSVEPDVPASVGNGGSAGSGVSGDSGGAPIPGPDDAGGAAGELLTCENVRVAYPYASGYTAPPDEQVAKLLARMSLAQKIQQMQGVPLENYQVDYTDLDASQDVVLDSSTTIRGYLYRDGSRGVDLAELQRGRASATSYSTSFPVTVARSASFDLELEYAVGEAMGDETAASRNTLLRAPLMNLLRHPLWGRAMPDLLSTDGSKIQCNSWS